MNKLSVAVMVLLSCVSCAGGRAYTQGTYEDPNSIEMLSDDFNENDLQLIAKKMSTSLDESPLVKSLPTRPLLIVGKVRNKTSEHIDMESLSDKVRVNLQRDGKFAFSNKAAREELAQEYEYQKSGYVKPDQAKGPGDQASADYLLTGSISSIIQQVGVDKLVYYKMTMELTNLKSGVIEWTDEKELRKKFKKRGISL